MKKYEFVDGVIKESINDFTILVLSKAEFINMNINVNVSEVINFTKLEEYDGYDLISFAIPSRDFHINKERKYSIYFDENKLYIVGEEEYNNNMISKANQSKKRQINTVYDFLGNYILAILDGEYSVLEQIEKELSKIEEKTINDLKNVSHKIISLRKKLIELGDYYDLLEDVCIKIKDDDNMLLGDFDEKLINLNLERIERLNNHTTSIREYANQVRELYQTEVDIKQNQVMKLLTAVTTICLPFTIVSGWYGMNFANIPELSYNYAYFIVMGVTLILIIILIVLFKKKKWF